MIIRKARKADIPEIVMMIADDKLGELREDYRTPLPEVYYEAFNEINTDPNQELIVAEQDNQIIGTLQLSFIRYLTYQGGTRTQVEGVRIRKDQRGKGTGKQLLEWAIKRARARKAHLIQLTTDKKRPEALAFYENLGFKASHEGAKLHFS